MTAGTPRVGVFHPGTQHSWQTALGFQESGQLAWYATSVFYDPGRWPYRLERLAPEPVSRWLHRAFARRYSAALAPALVRQLGFWEWFEIGARRLGARGAARWANQRGNESFGRLVIELTEREPVDVLWGYNTSALEVFRWAKRRGIRCVLDQTIGHCASMNRVMLAEQARNPEFFLPSYAPFSPEDIARQEEEIALADCVVVGSDSCARTLVENGCPPERIRVVPYGFDESIFPTEPPPRAPLGGRPVRFLFVGAIHARKGVATLLKTFAAIPRARAQLTLVGSLEIPPETFQRYADHLLHVPSASRRDVIKHYLTADCFIFPSLFEGSALVLYEAIGAGLGIIQSRYAGDGVRDGRNGEIVNELTVDALGAAVDAAVNDPRRLTAWQAASWQMRGDRTWQRYRERIRELVNA